MPTSKEDKLPKLSFDQRRGLLIDLEDSAIPLQALNLLDLCNSSEKFFGKPATPLRRAFQKQFAYLKKLPDKSYKVLLSRHTVEPNRFRSRTMPSTPMNDSTYSDSSSTDDTVEEATNMLSSLKFVSPSKTKPWPVPVAYPVALKPSPASKIKTPKSSHRTPPRTPPRTPHVTRQLFAGDSGDGTEERPWIVPVNPEYPERHGHGFFVQPVEKMTCGRYERSGFHIRTVGDTNFEKWNATIPQNVDPGLEDRVIEFRKPSVSSFFQNNEIYHKDIDCLATKNANNSTMVAIDEDKRRHWLYVWLVFPNGTILDNRVFSSDDEIVQMEGHGIEIPKEEIDLEEDFIGVGIYWRIAEKGGRRIAHHVGPSKMSSLFKSKKK
jgi:hypothetical protein